MAAGFATSVILRNNRNINGERKFRIIIRITLTENLECAKVYTRVSRKEFHTTHTRETAICFIAKLYNSLIIIKTCCISSWPPFIDHHERLPFACVGFTAGVFFLILTIVSFPVFELVHFSLSFGHNFKVSSKLGSYQRFHVHHRQNY